RLIEEAPVIVDRSLVCLECPSRRTRFHCAEYRDLERRAHTVRLADQGESRAARHFGMRPRHVLSALEERESVIRGRAQRGYRPGAHAVPLVELESYPASWRRRFPQVGYRRSGGTNPRGV